MIETWFNQDVKQAVKVRYIDGNVFSMDNNGNKIGVNLYDGETAVNVSGTVSANVIRSDGTTVAVSGSSSGNQAWVVLPQSCYTVPGVISIVIKATSSGNITTLCAVVANVYQSTTDTVVDPGTIIPSVEDLIEAIEDAVATIPADYSDLWTSLAPAFDSSATYLPRSYCTYNGKLYRFTATHTGSWNSNHAKVIAISTDVESFGRAIGTGFSSNSSYVVGRYATYDDILYRFIKNHSGSWDLSDVETACLADDIFNRCVTSVMDISSFGGENDLFASLADLPGNTLFRTRNAPDRPEWASAGSGLWIMTVKAPGTTYTAQMAFSASSGNMAFRYYVSGAYSEWTESPMQTKRRPVKILCIGNSYTQDNISYVPFLIDTMCKELDLTVGISHHSGAKINEYINWYDNDSRVLMYSKYTQGDAQWTNHGSNLESNPNNWTLKEILADDAWDIITFQQGSTQQGDWSTYSNLNGLVDRVVDYMRGRGNRHVRLGWLMPQIRKSTEGQQENTYQNLVTNCQKVLQTTPISFVIPCGTSVQNARNTSLDDLGVYGHMCYDDNGHLQEGVPCLVGAYAAMLKIMEIAGLPFVGVLANNTQPTTAWVEAKNVPIPHWDPDTHEVAGVTAANCYLAQKCAVAAVKFPYEVTTIT